ncbi:MAG TPA: NAD-dependent epimerase/dehydratase family protein [Opitutaceae bacterium]|nr:NAD-dependent epimerase/dehydratase family protein [Opitutaceae bacterium]
MKVLVTGAAGFIGHHVSARLAGTQRCEVLGVDNLNEYYPVALKRARLEQLAPLDKFRFVQLDLAEPGAFEGICAHFKPDYVVHLGAQAGVRYSIENPAAFTASNLVGFAHVLEACRQHRPKHLVFASSSSVYGAGAVAPFREDAETGRPLSFYAATKQSNEAMAYSYAHLHGLAVTGLRFFTVYGPWGRPDMAPIIFAKAISEGRPIQLFNHGKSRRDFTYIDDIVDGVLKVLLYPPAEPPVPAYRVFNLGHNRPVETGLFVQMLEQLLGRKAVVELTGPQPGDMPETCADLTRIRAAVGYEPRVPLEEGLRRFVAWFQDYYRPS